MRFQKSSCQQRWNVNLLDKNENQKLAQTFVYVIIYMHEIYAHGYFFVCIYRVSKSERNGDTFS
jgi:hypothetical protein